MEIVTGSDKCFISLFLPLGHWVVHLKRPPKDLLKNRLRRRNFLTFWWRPLPDYCSRLHDSSSILKEWFRELGNLSRMCILAPGDENGKCTRLNRNPSHVKEASTSCAKRGSVARSRSNLPKGHKHRMRIIEDLWQIHCHRPVSLAQKLVVKRFYEHCDKKENLN